jgi:hypothetical protein
MASRAGRALALSFVFAPRSSLVSLSSTVGRPPDLPLPSPPMQKNLQDQASFWDAAFKAIGGIVAIAGVTITVSKYFDERAKANQAALMEAQKPFYTKRQEIYYKLVSATACIGTNDHADPSRQEAEKQFWLLYWVAIPMIADKQVAEAIDAFSVAVDTPEDDILLRNTSMNLARACRKSLGYIEQ